MFGIKQEILIEIVEKVRKKFNPKLIKPSAICDILIFSLSSLKSQVSSLKSQTCNLMLHLSFTHD